MVKKQARFAFMVAILIIYATMRGYKVTLGDAWALKGEGRPHSKNSKHYDRLAIDLNLHKDGFWLKQTDDHLFLGEFWEFLGGSWGGRFGDGNHYQA